jgi:hypothetical protein
MSSALMPGGTMPEILTESFCERCGTRYTFESAAPRAAKLSGIKVLSRGLRNFVMSDDTSMDEAMAAARSETDREVTSQQLDAFHKTFNFCMTCRQYTCGNCWNEAEGRCLTCAPHLGHEILPAPFPDLPADGMVATDGAAANGANGHATAEPMDALAWPTMDLERDLDVEPDLVDAEPVEEIDAVARLAALGAVEAATDDETPVVDAIAAGPEAPEPEVAEASAAAAEVEAVVAEPEIEVPVAAEPVAADADEPVAVDAATDPQAAAAATQTNDLMQRFRPGQSLDAEIEAYEREQAEADAAAKALAAAAAAEAIEPEPIVEPEAVVDAPAEDDERAAALLAAAAAARRMEPEPEPAAPPRDVVEQPTWRIVAPDPEAAPPVAPVPESPAAAPPAAAQAEPQWPAQPQWPSQQSAGGLPYLNRPAQPTGGMDALWAASASEVASQAAAGAAARDASGVQPCVSCGLSLSATARFCRRCGTRQG